MPSVPEPDGGAPEVHVEVPVEGVPLGGVAVEGAPDVASRVARADVVGIGLAAVGPGRGGVVPAVVGATGVRRTIVRGGRTAHAAGSDPTRDPEDGSVAAEG